MLYDLPASDFNKITYLENGATSQGSTTFNQSGLGSPVANRLIPGLVGGHNTITGTLTDTTTASALPNTAVFLDANDNGQVDPGEASTITDTNGNYSFLVAPGTYQVRFPTAPAGTDPAPLTFQSGADYVAVASATFVPVPIFAVGGSDGSVRIINTTTGASISTSRPFDRGASPYTGLVGVALGDFNGDSVPDLAVCPADPVGVHGLDSSDAGKVFVYDGTTLSTTPTLLKMFTPFATHDGPDGTSGAYTNGLFIAAGDVDGDGNVDLVAGTRGGNGTTSGLKEYGRFVVIDGTSSSGTNTVIGGIQKPFGVGYQKGVVVAAGNVDGIGGDEIAVSRAGPVVSKDTGVQQIKVKVLQLQGTTLTALPLAADGSTAFAPFASLTGVSTNYTRDSRVTFVDTDGNGTDELVFSALDPLTTPSNEQVRIGVYSINVAASKGAATIVSTGPDSGTYAKGTGVVDHAITHVAGTGTMEELALLTESSPSGVKYLDPLTGADLAGEFALNVHHGGITFDGI